MKLIGCLSFFDEPIADLVRCVASLELAGVGHVVAVDGRYALFPGKAASSPSEQHDAIRAACNAINADLTLHVPRSAWARQEVEKRSFMHALAMAVSSSSDWHFVIDADEMVDVAPVDLMDRLRAAGEDVACVMTRNVGGGEGMRRRLFRAQPLTVGPSHCRYVASSGLVLSDSGQSGEVPALVLRDLVLSHRVASRSVARQAAKTLYYAAHSEGGHAMCERGCGREAGLRVYTGWRRVDGQLLSDPLDVCQDCAAQVRSANAAVLRGMGLNPDRIAQ